MSEILKRVMVRGDKKAREVRIRERSPRSLRRSRSPRPSEGSRSPRSHEKTRSPRSSDTRPSERGRSPRPDKRSRSPRPSDRAGGRGSDGRVRASRDDARQLRHAEHHSAGRSADSHRDKRPHHSHSDVRERRPVQQREKEAEKSEDIPEGPPRLVAKADNDSSSDSDKEQHKPGNIKIEDLIKELVDGPTSGEESGSGSEGEEEEGGAAGGKEALRESGEATSSDSDDDQEGAVSDVTAEEQRSGSKHSATGTPSTEKAADDEDRTPSLLPLGDVQLPDQGSRSKFDYPSDEEEGEGGRERSESDAMLVKRGYSGYNEGLSNGEDSSGGEDGEEEAKNKMEQATATVDDTKGNANMVEVEPEEEEEEPRSKLPCYYPGLMGCRNVECFEWLNRIEEGTYGVVYRARERTTG